MRTVLEFAAVIGNIIAIVAIAALVPNIGEGGIFIGLVALWVVATIVVVTAISRGGDTS